MRESARFSACEASFHRSIIEQEALLVKGQGFTSLLVLGGQGEGQDTAEQRVRWLSCLRGLGAWVQARWAGTTAEGPCSRVSLWWKVVEQLAKLMGDVTAVPGVCGRSGKEVFVGGKGFGVLDVLVRHMVVMV